MVQLNVFIIVGRVWQRITGGRTRVRVDLASVWARVVLTNSDVNFISVVTFGIISWIDGRENSLTFVVCLAKSILLT